MNERMNEMRSLTRLHAMRCMLAFPELESGKEAQQIAWIGWLAKNNVFTLLSRFGKKLSRHCDDMLISPMRSAQSSFKYLNRAIVKTQAIVVVSVFYVDE